jgi:hypothetical protein
MESKKFTVLMGMITVSLIVAFSFGTGKVKASSEAGNSGDAGLFRGPCGLSVLIQVEEKNINPAPNASYVVDAWTTNLPHANPWSEVYSFDLDVDTLAFVTEYYFEEGGFIPQQYIRAWDCGTYHKRGTCQYDWSLGPLPPGFTWLLINYYPPGSLPADRPGDYDWATKVGTAVLGYPAPGNRPDCFNLHF